MRLCLAGAGGKCLKFENPLISVCSWDWSLCWRISSEDVSKFFFKNLLYIKQNIECVSSSSSLSFVCLCTCACSFNFRKDLVREKGVEGVHEFVILYIALIFSLKFHKMKLFWPLLSV